MLKIRVSNPIDQSWTLEKIAKERPSRTWEHVFHESQYELEDISKILDEQEQKFGMYYPLKKHIFAAFDYTPLTLTNVVIIGQDPYPQSVTNQSGETVPRAQGLSFSTLKGDVIPSSLKNIYKELVNSYKGFEMPDHGDLTSWCKQGVLMLNIGLTVRANSPGSHGEIWHGFIKRVCKAITAVNPKCIYILWGNEAQKIEGMLGEKSVILKSVHPSGMSANRGFFGCNHFNLCNEILLKQGKSAINWHL